MKKSIEELLNTPYWIIDILPKQVPAGSAGQYFTIDQYLRDTFLPEIKRKHLNLILKLNCYRDISLDEDDTVNPPPEQIADAVNQRYVSIMTGDSMIVSDPEDMYLTIFNPDEELLSLVRELASGEGMFVWRNENEHPDLRDKEKQ